MFRWPRCYLSACKEVREYMLGYLKRSPFSLLSSLFFSFSPFISTRCLTLATLRDRNSVQLLWLDAFSATESQKSSILNVLAASLTCVDFIRSLREAESISIGSLEAKSKFSRKGHSYRTTFEYTRVKRHRG